MNTAPSQTCLSALKIDSQTSTRPLCRKETPDIVPSKPASPLHHLHRGFFLLLALAFLTLGILGVFIPGLPTTVFILLAAWAAAKGSPRLLSWLENHRLFGAMIRDWRAGGTVSRKAKWSATLMMSLCAVILFATTDKAWVAEFVSLIMLAVLIWLWRRPEPDKPHAGHP